jgi:hypothetical protein
MLIDEFLTDGQIGKNFSLEPHKTIIIVKKDNLLRK